MRSDRHDGATEGPVKPFSTVITILVLALILQTAYIPEYCHSQSRGGTQSLVNIDQSLTRDYCFASQVRDHNAPVSQWIDTLNYDLVAVGDLLGGLFSQIGGAQQPHK